jgi:hypothetical protein
MAKLKKCKNTKILTRVGGEGGGEEALRPGTTLSHLVKTNTLPSANMEEQVLMSGILITML